MLKQRYRTTPVIALTATATARVVQDVLAILRIPNARQFRASVNRPNLFYQVISIDWCLVFFGLVLICVYVIGFTKTKKCKNFVFYCYYYSFIYLYGFDIGCYCNGWIDKERFFNEIWHCVKQKLPKFKKKWRKLNFSFV